MTPSGMNDMGLDTDAAAPTPTPPSAPDGQDGQDGQPMNQDCVPLSALNMPDESEQMTSPEVGDMVQYTSEGKVAKIEGDQAYIDRSAINGQPVGDQTPADQNPAQPDANNNSDDGDGDNDELEELQNQAKGVQLQ